VARIEPAQQSAAGAGLQRLFHGPQLFLWRFGMNQEEPIEAEPRGFQGWRGEQMGRRHPSYPSVLALRKGFQGGEEGAQFTDALLIA
jgi:hypothetical protein